MPNNNDCSPPMLWAESERGRLLEGTGLLRRVDNDLERIEEDFTTLVLPFMQKYQHYFRYENNCITSVHSQVIGVGTVGAPGAGAPLCFLIVT